MTDSRRTNRILVPVSEYGEFGAMMALCQTLASEIGCHPIFIFAHGYGMVKEHARQVEHAGWSWVHIEDGTSSILTPLDENTRGGYRPLPAKLARRIRYHPDSYRKRFVRTRSLFAYVRMLIKECLRSRSPVALSLLRPMKFLTSVGELGKVRSIIRQLRPRLIISGQDFPLSITSICAKAGQEAGLETVIVPFSMPATTKEIIESFAHFQHRLVTPQLRKFSQRSIPEWLNYRRGRLYLRASPADAVITRFLGLAPDTPWLPNMGAGILLAPSPWAYRYYMGNGIPEDRLRLTGATWNDKLVNSELSRGARREQLAQLLYQLLPKKLQRKNEKSGTSGMVNAKIMIVSWPTNQYPRSAVGCETYEELCRQLTVALQGIQAALPICVTVSLHPTLSDPMITTLLRKAGIPILRGSLLQHIDCADFFVSPVSSTAFWALQSNVPTINLDCYLYGYTEFDEAGAITVTTPHDIMSVCMRLCHEAGYLEAVQARIESKRPDFGMRDGKSTRRIVDVIAALAADPQITPVKRAFLPSFRRKARHTRLDVRTL